MVSYPPSIDALAAAIDDGALPRAVVIEIVGARHEAVLSHPDDVAKAIAGFVT